MRSYHWVAIIGIILAVWMSAGRWVFGLGGSLTWWYVPTIGACYIWLQLWAAKRIRTTQRKGRPTAGRTIGSQILSWVCAVAFGFTVPDNVGGEFVSIVGAYGGTVWNEMSIALCNPFGILAFALAVAGIAFAAVDAREPIPEEDEFDGPQPVMRHPLV